MCHVVLGGGVVLQRCLRPGVCDSNIHANMTVISLSCPPALGLFVWDEWTEEATEKQEK